MWFSKKNRELKKKREKVFNLLMEILIDPTSVLNNKYQKTHGKIAVDYNGHVVEIIEDEHGEKYVIKFHKSHVSLKKKQFKKIMDRFNGQVIIRGKQVVDFDYLSKVYEDDHCCKKGTGDTSGCCKEKE